MADRITKSLSPDRNEAVRRFVLEIVETRFPLPPALLAKAKVKGNVQAAAKAFGLSQSMLYEFLDGKRGAGMKLLDGVAAFTGADLEVVMGRRTADAPTESGDPYVAIRARPDFQALPPWAQSYWAAQVATYAGSRQTDRRKLARFLDELDAVIVDVASGKLTEANAVAVEEIAGVAPTPPEREPPPALPLAKGLDADGRPTRQSAKKGRH